MELNAAHSVEQTIAAAKVLDQATMGLLCAVAGTAAGSRTIISSAVTAYFDHGGAAERLYEAILQTYLFAGFPAAIEGLKAAHTIADKRQISLASALDEPYVPERFLTRGIALFGVIYGNASDRVRQFISSLSPALEQWMLIEGYGKVLSRPAAISLLDRELAAVVALAVGGWQTQLRWHMQAAIALGASSSTLEDALACAALVTPAERIIAAQQLADTL